MRWLGDVSLTKEFHFTAIYKGSNDIWYLEVQEQSTFFFVLIDQIQKIAKQFNLKQISMINRKLEDRLIVLTYDGFSVIHTFQLKADYRGPKIPAGGIERELNLGKESRKKPKLF